MIESVLYDHIFNDLVRTLAAGFWTNCSFLVEDAGQPAYKACKYDIV